MVTNMDSKIKLFTATLLITACMIVLAGCGSGTTLNNTPAADNGELPDQSSANDKNDMDADVQDEEKAMLEFTALLESNSSAAELIRYMNAHISEVSAEQASKMVDSLEQQQRAQLKALEDRFYVDNDIQIQLQEVYKPDFNLGQLEGIEHEGLKQLLTDARDGGYKVETAEGMYYPVIDYEFYTTFSSHLTEDMQAYIRIMAAESNEVPIKDAAILISWDEVVKRALQQEQFLLAYPDSVKLKDIEELHKRYVSFTYYGSNNTPLFEYDGQTIKAEAKSAYTAAIKDTGNSEFLIQLSEFLDVVNKNNNKLTEEVEQSRKTIAG